jgi:pSer/pThr/pTyr-binding forkhead associated (FHA) protein
MFKQLSITLMSGPHDGDILTFPIPTDMSDAPLVLTIGRREGLDISLEYDSQVSRLHAHLGFDGESFWLEDTGSRNGTFIGDQKLSPGDRILLEPGTLFRVGRTWLRLDPLPTDVTAPAEPIDPDDGSIF